MADNLQSDAEMFEFCPPEVEEMEELGNIKQLRNGQRIAVYMLKRSYGAPLFDVRLWTADGRPTVKGFYMPVYAAEELLKILETYLKK